MYLYVRKVLLIGLESGTVAAVTFGAIVYWLSYWAGTPDLPMAIASISALLVLCHHIAKSIGQPSSARVLLPVIALAVVFYVFAVHSAVHSVLTSLSVAWTEFVDRFAARLSKLPESERSYLIGSHLQSAEDVDVYSNEEIGGLLDEHRDLIAALVRELEQDSRFT